MAAFLWVILASKDAHRAPTTTHTTADGFFEKITGRLNVNPGCYLRMVLACFEGGFWHVFLSSDSPHRQLSDELRDAVKETG